MANQLVIKRRRATARLTRGLVIRVCLAMCMLSGSHGFGVGTANAVDVPPVDPYEVIVYEHKNYVGKQVSFKLDPQKMRQLLVRDLSTVGMANKISSVAVGSKVSVALFTEPDFSGQYEPHMPGWVQVGWDSGGGSDLRFRGGRAYSPGEVDANGIDDKVMSLIVFPRDAKMPLGVGLFALSFYWGLWGQFFPLPESLDETAIKHPVSLNFTGAFITNKNIQVTLYEQPGFAGQWLTLPQGAGGFKKGLFIRTGTDVAKELQKGYSANYTLRNIFGTFAYLSVGFTGVEYQLFNFSPGAKSMEVRWLAPGAVPSALKVHTAVLAGQLPPPTTSGVANLSGKWDSSIGQVYEITQSGNQFSWFAATIKQQGTGTVSGKSVSASWQDPGGAGSAKGNITQLDPGGLATRIEWDNGVVFFRKTQPPAGAPPSPPAQQTPGPAAWNLEDMTDLPGMDYKVFWLNGGVDECMKACESDPNCKAFTYFGPGVQGPQARCYLKSGVPSPVKNTSVSGVRPSQQAPSQQPTAPPVEPNTPNVPDISGNWNSSIGVAYVITQTGNQFSWKAAKVGQSGSGTVAGKTITASWSDAGGSGSAKGTVTEVDANGRATRIEWDNGVVFFR